DCDVRPGAGAADAHRRARATVAGALGPRRRLPRVELVARCPVVAPGAEGRPGRGGARRRRQPLRRLLLRRSGGQPRPRPSRSGPGGGRGGREPHALLRLRHAGPRRVLRGTGPDPAPGPADVPDVFDRGRGRGGRAAPGQVVHRGLRGHLLPSGVARPHPGRHVAHGWVPPQARLRAVRPRSAAQPQRQLLPVPARAHPGPVRGGVCGAGGPGVRAVQRAAAGGGDRGAGPGRGRCDPLPTGVPRPPAQPVRPHGGIADLRRDPHRGGSHGADVGLRVDRSGARRPPRREGTGRRLPHLPDRLPPRGARRRSLRATGCRCVDLRQRQPRMCRGHRRPRHVGGRRRSGQRRAGGRPHAGRLARAGRAPPDHRRRPRGGDAHGLGAGHRPHVQDAGHPGRCPPAHDRHGPARRARGRGRRRPPHHPAAGHHRGHGDGRDRSPRRGPQRGRVDGGGRV
ncbi:MAG: Acetylornithine aminotransferase, partial [uncultured Acidimicrobiales bacterium]